MLSDDERYVQRGTGPTRDPMAPNQYASLGSRRQSARPSAPPSAPSSAYAMQVQHLSHPFAQRQQQDPRSAEGYSHPSSEPSTSQHGQYLPRQSHSGDSPAVYNRGSLSSRRPMNPPSLNLPSEPAQTALASNSSGGPTVAGQPLTSPSSVLNSPMSPPRQSNTRPSSRRALVAALSLAQEAVKLDTAGNSPQAAVDAYARSVVLLREVMSRVSSGESASGSSSRNGSTSRSLTPREEEVGRLKSIHDTYAERLEVLCNMYNIPFPDLRSYTRATPSAPPSRNPSQEVLSVSHQTTSRAASRSPRPADVDNAGNILSTLAQSPERETTAANPFVSESGPVNSAAALNRVSALPPQRPPPIGPLPPKPLTPLTARPIMQPPQDQAMHLPQPVTRERRLAHRRIPSNESEATSANDSDRTEVVSRPPSSASAVRRPSTLSEDQTVHPTTVASSFRRVGGSPTSPSTPRGGHEQQPAKRGVSTSSRISTTTTTTYDSVTSSSTTGIRSRGNTTSSASSWSEVGGEISDKASQVVGSTTQGSIAARRKVNSGGSTTGVPAFPLASSPPPPPLPGPSQSAGNISNRLTADSLPPSTLSSLGIAPGRSRAVSQPGRRPSNSADASHGNDSRPPLPATAHGSLMIPRKMSIPHSMGNIAARIASQPQGINITVQTADGTSHLQTPGPTNGVGLHLQSQQAAPPSPPVDPLRKPFHLMSLLLASITSKQGGYLTRKLYIPHDVWSQGGAKLGNLTEKGKCVELLNAGLEEVAVGSGEFFRGAGRGNAEKWLKCLDEWFVVCDSVLAGPGKKLGVGEGFTGRKINAVSSWGGKFSKALDRMTTAKGFDSPTVYTAGLSKLLHQAQMFDEHVKAFSNSFTPTPYSTLPPDIRHQIELRLKRSSEFFASVVLTWVVRDLGLLLDKYVKKGEKWLAE